MEQLVTGGQDRTWGVAEFVRKTMGLGERDLDPEALGQLAAVHKVGGCVGVGGGVCGWGGGLGGGVYGMYAGLVD